MKQSFVTFTEDRDEILSYDRLNKASWEQLFRRHKQALGPRYLCSTQYFGCARLQVQRRGRDQNILISCNGSTLFKCMPSFSSVSWLLFLDGLQNLLIYVTVSIKFQNQHGQDTILGTAADINISAFKGLPTWQGRVYGMGRGCLSRQNTSARRCMREDSWRF